jgi:hypothetical protein
MEHEAIIPNPYPHHDKVDACTVSLQTLHSSQAAIYVSASAASTPSWFQGLQLDFKKRELKLVRSQEYQI